ncbi:trypsin-like serine protease [Actinomadura sp. ATCC 31491]|uniref:Trypsin-like serine protease n=1 Tax=Actinomadura luzonensis TaxID=2805427 RepID=A0ABT0G8Z3_9ACTN|nr:trypsin-like serine protease [Actinomadura luzonensis]MCK2221065.1 trypsin-like serine protease [Actinomadura luzonensis]
MRYVPFVLVAAGLLAGAPALPAAAITNGSADGNAHPEVGALVADRPHSDGTWTYCTGTLVSPTVFLTAAHCGEKGQKTARVTFDSQYRPGGVLHDGRYIPDPRFKDESDLHDMAVVVFDKPVTGIRPAQLPAPGLLDRLKAEGELARFTPVGYGSLAPRKKAHEEVYEYTDTRRQATISYKGMSPRWLDLSLASKSDGSTCFGDSGGPNFLGGPDSHLLVATSISGADDACKGTNYDYRLDSPSARKFLGRYVTLPSVKATTDDRA